MDKVEALAPEADVWATNEGVLRYCKRCGSSTIWKVGQPGAVPTSPPAPAPPHLSAPSNLPAGQPSSGSAGAYSAMAPTELIIGGLPGPAAQAPFTSSYRPARTSEPAQAPSASATSSVLTLPAASGKPGQKSAGKSGAPRVNRRKYPRTKVNCIALVRHAEHGEEFVQCEDISRGGLRFKSTSKYMEQTLIEVAAPYSSGQPAIFVAARIVYAQELPEQNLFRYGAQYLNTR